MATKLEVESHEEDCVGWTLHKRTCLPYTLRAICPKCGQTVSRDLRHDYLNYPEVGIPIEEQMECEGPGDGEYCGTFPIRFRVDLTLSPITD